MEIVSKGNGGLAKWMDMANLLRKIYTYTLGILSLIKSMAMVE